MIYDTHAHYDSQQYDEDREAVLKELGEKVFRIINTGADMASSVVSVRMTEKYDFMRAAVGVHPDSAGELDSTENRETLEKLCDKEKVLAVGEIGLDYHWDVWPRDVQQKAFAWQWELALRKDLPIVIHSRDAAEDTLRIVKEFYQKTGRKPLRADMHCYSYSCEHAEEYLKMGLMFGIGGVLTFKNAKKLKEVVDLLPLERILLETDAPYMAPDPFRGKRNDSAKLSLVAEKIAEIKGIPVEKVYEQTKENACSFFAD